MDMLFNPVIVAVVVLCVLCLFKLNVLMSMLVAVFVGGMLGGLGIEGTKNSLLAGLGSNGETALAYILLGTFATAMTTTGIVGMLGRSLTKIIGQKKIVFLLVLAGVACMSQNLVPVHIAFIPILVPPMLVLMNKLKIDRRATACAMTFGLKAPYIAIPAGFGLIFQGIIADNMTQNGMAVTRADVVSVN